MDGLIDSLIDRCWIKEIKKKLILIFDFGKINIKCCNKSYFFFKICCMWLNEIIYELIKIIEMFSIIFLIVFK